MKRVWPGIVGVGLIGVIWFVTGKEPVSPSSSPASGSGSEAAVEPATVTHGSKHAPASSDRRPAHTSPRHGDRSEQQLVRFDLTLPKEERTFCDHCDPFRKFHAGTFDRTQQALLARAAQFSDYTESEVWELVAGAPERVEELEGAFRQVVRRYEARSISYFTARSTFGDALIAEGAYRELAEVDDSVYGDQDQYVSRVVENGEPQYRVAALTAGLDADYDRALLRRAEAEQAVVGYANAMLARFRAQDVR